jgi:hypothetical protein
LAGDAVVVLGDGVSVEDRVSLVFSDMYRRPFVISQCC